MSGIQQPATVKDVAAAAAVSVSTVSNVLNGSGRVSKETARRVRDIMAELGFVRNDAARTLRAGKTMSIGLVVIDLSNPFFVELARGADKRASEDGLQVVVGNSDRSQEREDRYLELFEQQRVRGLLLSPIGDPTAGLHRLRDHGVHTVLVDRESRDSGFASVSVDDIAGGFLAVNHLLTIGRRRVCFVGSPTSTQQAADRLTGARAAVRTVEAATLEVIDTSDLTIVGGRAAAQRILSRGDIDGVFATNDLLALGLLQGLNGVRIPDDIAVIGYDDLELGAAAPVPLATVRQPTELVGYRAVDMLLREADSPEQVVFQPELVVRASAGRA